MNSSRNLIVALLALWCYAHNSNINLANNATMLLVLYALLNRGGNNSFNGNNLGAGPNRQPQFGIPMNNNGTSPMPFSSTPTAFF